MAFNSCCLSLNKVGGWYGLVELKFWVWPYLCGGTASLKFRQFNSAVCDALGCYFVLGGFAGCGLLGMCWGTVVWPFGAKFVGGACEFSLI